MDRFVLINYILEFSSAYSYGELTQLDTRSLVLIKVHIEVEQAKKQNIAAFD